MENVEMKRPDAQFSINQFSPKDPTWLVENVEEVNQSFKQIRKLIEEDEKSDEIIARIEDILHKHHFLAAQYEQLHRDSELEFSKGSCVGSPDRKADMQKAEFELSSPESSQRSDNGSSEISSDSESESYKSSAKKSSRSPSNVGKIWEHNFVEVEKEIDLAEVREKITKYEEELSLLNQKLQFSEEQVEKLKNEIEEITGNFKSQLELAKSEIQESEANLEMEKKKVSELQMLETQIVDSNGKIAILEMELEAFKTKLESSEKAQVRYQTDISERDNEIKNLGTALEDATKKLYMVEAQLQTHISTMSEHLMLVEARAEEWEMRSKFLEKEIEQRVVDKIEMQKLHEAQEITLKAEVNEKNRSMEVLNKEFDGFKVKYDELMTEKDGLIAQIHTLGAQLDSKDNEIRQMKDCILGSEKLRLRMEELEKEVESQKVVISDRAEEKREAIRQLCFSLEHYRNGYEELRKAFSGNKRRAVMAS